MPRISLQPLVAKRLVRLLASDDEFRNFFISDTRAALANIGHIPDDPAELDAFLQICFNNVQLASREEISSAESEIFAMLTAGTGYSVPMLEAGRHLRTLKAVPSATEAA